MAPRPEDLRKARDGDDGVPPEDGAKPGAEYGTTTKARDYTYDADERAKRREGDPITIGGIVWHRLRKNWLRTRQLRALLRRQDRAFAKVRRLQARQEAMTEELRGVPNVDAEGFPLPGWKTPPADDERAEAIETSIDQLQDEIEQQQDEADDAAYEIIRTLISQDGTTPEEPQQPELDFLKGNLDVEEAGELAQLLSTGREPDPMPPTRSS